MPPMNRLVVTISFRFSSCTQFVIGLDDYLRSCAGSVFNGATPLAPATRHVVSDWESASTTGPDRASESAAGSGADPRSSA